MSDKRRILVVDDEPINIKILNVALRDEYDISVATNGKAALEFVDSGNALDLILLDIMMPEISGLEVLEELRKTHSLSELPIIMATAMDQSTDIVKALELGANDYVTKPIDIPVLKARVQTQINLKVLSELKNKFLGIAAHDLRNPLSVIKGYVGLFTAGILGEVPEEQKEYYGLIDNACESMLQLINDLLDISAIESGKLDLEFQNIDPNLYLKENYSANSILAKAKSINLDLDIPDTLPQLRCDPNRVTQVINNLITNAIKFSYPETTITIHARVNDNDVEISVEDQGQGIPEAEIPKIFAEFGRSSVQSTAGEKSTGLGLAIVKRIVEAHNGRIWVESETGRGTTFFFNLPLTQEE
jgi:signal transduction histidine kinase